MNQKTTLRLAGSFLALLFLILVPPPTFAQEGDFKETFAEAAISGWEFSPGTLINEGVLVIPPHNFAARFGVWAEITLDVRLMTTGPGEVIIHYAFTDQSRYSLHFAPEEVWLERSSEDISSNLAFAPTAPLSTGEWSDLRVIVTDGRHQVSIDGTLILEATDPDPLPAGGFLFMAEGERTATIDEIQVTGGVPAEPAPSPPEPESPLGEPLTENQPAGPISDSQTPEIQGSDPLEDLLAGLINQGTNRVELSTFVGNLLLAAIFSFILSRVYVHWGSSLSNRRRFAANFMLITITTTFIILVVRSSVALSLGLVGALSIVRFRTAIKEPEELAYLFFAIGLGIGLGDNQRMITLIALAVGILLIGLMRLFRRSQADVNLHLSILDKNTEKLSLEQIIATVEDHCSKWKLIRYDEGPEVLEAAFLVEFQELAALSSVQAAFTRLSDAIEITFLDNQGIE